MGRLRSIFYYLFALTAIPLSFIVWNVYSNHLNLLQLRENEEEFRSHDISKSPELNELIGRLPDGFGVLLLNRFAVKMTFNWLCNTKRFNVHSDVMFIVMDEFTKRELLNSYPDLHVFVWHAVPLQGRFLPYDATYMSFFLMRTNMIQALQSFNKTFWMLQADTIWRENLFDIVDVKNFEGDILLDQQGFQDVAPARQQIMNGANFMVPSTSSSKELVSKWLDWQKAIYVTDPDLVKLFCLRGDFQCKFLPYHVASGWEWIYGTQSDPPAIIQMDGETGGNKENVLARYGFWFLDADSKCVDSSVDAAIDSIRTGQVPKIYSKSKTREAFYLKLGEILNQMPIFGYYSSVYGGLTSLYLQIF